jgi:hypothetical protein
VPSMRTFLPCGKSSMSPCGADDEGNLKLQRTRTAFHGRSGLGSPLEVGNNTRSPGQYDTVAHLAGLLTPPRGKTQGREYMPGAARCYPITFLPFVPVGLGLVIRPSACRLSGSSKTQQNVK